MTTITSKYIVFHKNPVSLSLHCARAALFIVCFPAKVHESWMHVILVVGFGLGLGHKEATVTHSDLNWWPQH